MIKNRSFFKITALLVLISFSSVQPVWARGRRGGNSGGDLAIAAAGGAALPLGAVVGAGIAGGGFAGPAYQAALSSSTFGMAAGNITAAGLTAGGADPHTTSLISAGVSGLASGISSVNIINSDLALKNSANLTFQQATAKIGSSVAGSMTSAEVGYQLNEAGVPLSGAIGSIAGTFAGAATFGSLSGDGFSDVLTYGAGQAIGKNGSNIGYAVASDLVSDAIVDMAGERSLARPYAGYVGGLGGRLAGHFTDVAIAGELNIAHPDYGKQAKFGHVPAEQTFAGMQTIPDYQKQQEAIGHRFISKNGELREYESVGETYIRGLDGREMLRNQQLMNFDALQFEKITGVEIKQP